MPSFHSSLFWSFAMSGGRYGLSALVMVALAAILGPEAFGIVAIAMVYVLFLQMFIDQGLGPAIIQRKNLEARHLDAAFWMLLGAGAVLTAISLALSGWWAGVNQLPELAPVIAALSFMIPIRGLTVVQEAILQRQMNFRVLAIRVNASTALGGVLGVATALGGLGVWALVVQHLATALIGLILLWGLSDWRPSLRFSRSAARELLGFSTGALLGTIGMFVYARADTLLMGIFFGPVTVGIYRLADRIMSLGSDLAARAIQAVALPEFSRIREDRDELITSLKRCVRTSANIVIPALGVLAMSSREVTMLVGPEWEDAARPLSMLCLVGMVRAVSVFSGPLMYAVGRPHALAMLVWIQAALSALAFYSVAVLLEDGSVREQAVGIAASRAVLFVLVFLPMSWLVAMRLSSLAGVRLIRSIGGGVFAGAAAMALVEGFRASGVVPASWPVVRSVATIAIGAIAASACVWMLESDLRQAILRPLRRAAKRETTVAESPPDST